MAAKKKADSAGIAPPPSEGAISQAVADLIARVLAEMAKIPGLVPGTQAWVDTLERRINSAIDGTFVLKLKTELLEKLPALIQGGSGPVTKDDVDLA